jgi:hypothetical protein
MNKETTQLVIVAATLIGVLILGVIFIALSRWGQNKKAALEAQGEIQGHFPYLKSRATKNKNRGSVPLFFLDLSRV